MSNWLADPVACAVRLKNQSGCTILRGRGEAMGRTTNVVRAETPTGSRYTWGHLFVRTEGKPGQQRTMFVGVNLPDDEYEELDALTPEHANVMSDLLRAAYANAGGESCGGKSLYDMVWDELDAITDRLMADQSQPDDVGAARGIAYVLAIMQNPYKPNVDSIKEQAMERWEDNGE